MINTLALIPGASWKHPNSRLQSAWDFTRIGVVVFPLLPSVGALLILISTIKTWRQVGKEITQQRLNWGFAGLGIWMMIVSLFGQQNQKEM